MDQEIRPSAHAFSIAPSDSEPLAKGTRGLYVGSSGNVRVTMAGGEVVTFTDLAAGVIHPLYVRQVHATGTTATNILGLY